MYKFLIIIVVVVVCLIAICFVISQNRLSVEPYMKLRNIHEKLYDMWDKVQPIFKKYNIEYFADGGTILGAYREGKIIAHDDDIDIGIMKEDEPKLFSKQFQDDLAKENLKFSTEHYVYKIFPTDNLKDVFIDIFVYEIEGDKFNFASKDHRESWPNAYFIYEELFPLAEYKFGKTKILGANNPKNYFARQYGKNWLIPVKSHTHHDIEN